MYYYKARIYSPTLELRCNYGDSFNYGDSLLNPQSAASDKRTQHRARERGGPISGLSKLSP